MSESVYAGLTSQTIDVLLYDSSSTTGAGLTGLAYNSSGLSCYYRKGATGSATSISLATQTVGGAWSSGGFVQIDATNMPGVYRFDVPNAVVDSEGFATVYFSGATNLVPTAIRIDCRPLPSDLKKIQTDAQSVTDLKDFADAGYDPATNKVQGVVLVDTTTTNTDMRGTDSAFLDANAPTNFSDLAITSTTGLVSVGTNNDKTGYSISGTKNTLDDLNDVSTAQVNAEVDTALGDYDGPTKTEMDAAFAEIKGATWNSSTDTLEEIRDNLGAGGGGDATEAKQDIIIAALGVVDGIVDSILVDTGTTLPATLSTILADTNELQTNQGNWLTATGFSTHTAADVRTEMDSNSTQLAAIVADTNELQTNQGNWLTATGFSTHSAEDVRTEMDANSTQLAAIVADTNELQTNQGDWTTADVSGLATAAALATVDANVDSILTDTGTSIPATLTTILADTNELQTNQGNWITADVSGLATAAALATVDTNVDAILVDTGTTIPGTITTLDTNLDAVKAVTDQINFGVAGQVDANVESINRAAVNGSGTSGDKWRGS